MDIVICTRFFLLTARDAALEVTGLGSTWRDKKQMSLLMIMALLIQ